MAYWLFKEEPDHYCWADLERDGRAVWDGISNNLALKNLRQVKAGDRVFFYHTGKEKAVVGEMKVVSGPKPDPKTKDPKSVVVEIAPLRRLPQPVSLKQIKDDAELADWELVRLPRLSVMAVTGAQWKRVQTLSRVVE